MPDRLHYALFLYPMALSLTDEFPTFFCHELKLYSFSVSLDRSATRKECKLVDVLAYHSIGHVEST